MRTKLTKQARLIRVYEKGLWDIVAAVSEQPLRLREIAGETLNRASRIKKKARS